jgi:tRNA threonylcarbamoyladenosine biosynthesis protein TsaB
VNLLLIDSTKPELTVAVAAEGKIIDTQINAEQRQHDKNINAMVCKCLANAGLNFADLSATAVVIGPGSWTGIRVGLSAVKAYAYALDIPIIELTDKLDLAEAENKFMDKNCADAFTSKPFYNGEFNFRPAALGQDSKTAL